jgi:protein-tyrosine-phosphatase
LTERSTDRPLRILTVCSGNVSRSPLAEHLVDRVAMTYAIDVEVLSGGTLGLVDRPSPRNLIAVAREIGIDLSGHRSKPVTREQVDWADHILVMELQHATYIREQFQIDDDRIVSLGPLVGKHEIDDPTGSWFKAPYRALREELTEALQRFFGSLAGR